MQVSIGSSTRQLTLKLESSTHKQATAGKVNLWRKLKSLTHRSPAEQLINRRKSSTRCQTLKSLAEHPAIDGHGTSSRQWISNSLTNAEAGFFDNQPRIQWSSNWSTNAVAQVFDRQTSTWWNCNSAANDLATRGISSQNGCKRPIHRQTRDNSFLVDEQAMMRAASRWWRINSKKSAACFLGQALEAVDEHQLHCPHAMQRTVRWQLAATGWLGDEKETLRNATNFALQVMGVVVKIKTLSDCHSGHWGGLWEQRWESIWVSTPMATEHDANLTLRRYVEQTPGHAAETLSASRDVSIIDERTRMLIAVEMRFGAVQARWLHRFSTEELETGVDRERMSSMADKQRIKMVRWFRDSIQVFRGWRAQGESCASRIKSQTFHDQRHSKWSQFDTGNTFGATTDMV
jgi:hypothetical protein